MKRSKISTRHVFYLYGVVPHLHDHLPLELSLHPKHPLTVSRSHRRTAENPTTHGRVTFSKKSGFCWVITDPQEIKISDHPLFEASYPKTAP